MKPWSTEPAGRLDEREIDSVLLRDNPLGDPSVRPLWVQVPPGYDDSDRRYPTIYLIQGYTGHVAMWHNRRAYRPTTPEAVDALQADPDVPDFLAVYVDAWTLYGGSQFVDSSGTGRYHSYLCDEVVPWVDDRYRTLADRDHRAITGKSSGGFGAMITPMLRPDLFGALATHAGDALYEYLYLPEFSRSVRALRDYDGDIWAWWRDFSSRVAGTKPADDVLLMELGVAACFSADEDGTVRLPFDTRTGVLDEGLWQRWLEWDPVRMLQRPDLAEAMRSLRGAWVDGGTSDEWNLDLGAQAFADGLLDVGLPADRLAFEHFEGGHGGIEYRYPLALSWLAHQMTP
ncbi:alpha/beta hydrolase [Solicola sp. PLA-1-18]|uniref:alpha/beta hydrolase n=1 Tax=Solicola sp. PLA-1-18 TaxID=3380532 RepID=UPI003B7BD7EE